MADAQSTIDALLTKNRVFEPSAELRNRALWDGDRIHEQASGEGE